VLGAIREQRVLSDELTQSLVAAIKGYKQTVTA